MWLIEDLKAKVTLIPPVTVYRKDLQADWQDEDEPQNWTLSTHEAIIMELKSGCQLKIRKFVSSESYKLAPFLSSAKKQTEETNKLDAELKTALHASLGEVNVRTVEGLKTVSKTELGISVKKRVTDTRVHTDVKEVARGGIGHVGQTVGVRQDRV